MQNWLIALFSAVGVSVGALQVWLLSRLLSSITAKKYADAALPLVMKAAVYAAVFAVTVLLFADYLLPLGTGLGGGIIIAAVIGTAAGIKKNK